MAWVCPPCGSRFWLPLTGCRVCGSPHRMVRKVRRMAKSSNSGVTDQHAGPDDPGYMPPAGEADQEAGEVPRPGSSSKTSSEKPEPSETSKPGGGPKRARTTENPSSQDRAGSGIARSTAGSSRGTGNARGDKA